jgi:hypothetical protein
MCFARPWRRSGFGCPADHGMGSRSQILIEARSMVSRGTGERFEHCCSALRGGVCRLPRSMGLRDRLGYGASCYRRCPRCCSARRWAVLSMIEGGRPLSRQPSHNVTHIIALRTAWVVTPRFGPIAPQDSQRWPRGQFSVLLASSGMTLPADGGNGGVHHTRHPRHTRIRSLLGRAGCLRRSRHLRSPVWTPTTRAWRPRATSLGVSTSRHEPSLAGSRSVCSCPR